MLSEGVHWLCWQHSGMCANISWAQFNDDPTLSNRNKKKSQSQCESLFGKMGAVQENDVSLFVQ